MTKLLTMPVMRAVVLAVALLVWINISLVSSRTTTVLAPLEIRGLGSGLAVAGVITKIEARVSGSLRDVGQLTGDSIIFRLDLTDIDQPGRHSREVLPHNLPNGIKLISFHPQTLVMDIDEEVSKRVPVTIKTTGLVADDYSIEDVSVTPDHATLYGAKQVLDTISEARTYVDVNGRSSSMTAPVQYIVETATGGRIQTVRIFPIQGKAAVTIKRGAAFRSLGVRPAFTGELPGGFWVREVTFDPAVITVRGHQKQLQDLVFLITTPISLTDKTNSFYDQVAIDLPHGIEVVGENLIHTHVLVDSAQGTRQMSVVPKYVNVTEGFSVTTIKPSSVQVVLSGDPDVIRQIGRGDVVLNLDLQGALSGTNSIEINPAMFVTKEGLVVVSFAPKSVEVVLSRLE